MRRISATLPTNIAPNVGAGREPPRQRNEAAPGRSTALFSAARQMVREKIGDQRPIPKRHVVADVIAAFEDDHLLRAGRLLEDALRLLARDEILCAVDDLISGRYRNGMLLQT